MGVAVAVSGIVAAAAVLLMLVFIYYKKSYGLWGIARSNMELEQPSLSHQRHTQVAVMLAKSVYGACLC